MTWFPAMIMLMTGLCAVVAPAPAPAAPAPSAPVRPRFQEPDRPQFHYTPEKNWLNDPNGLVYHAGEWQLFHQYNPESVESANKSWAHAVSRDLVHWEHLPLPDALRYGGGIEIWSGSAVVDTNNTSGFGSGAGKDNPPLVAFYTAAGHGKQVQHLAYSTDGRGRTWTNFSGNPIIVDENLKDFRDPKVCWHEPTKQWVMVVAVSEQRKIRFYSSPDLKKWSQLSEFGPAGSVEGVWECPDLFPLTCEGKTYWVLVVNVGWGGPAAGNDGKGMSGTQYFVGAFDGKTFASANSKEETLWADYGPDNYAGQTWSDVPANDGRRISIGWMSNTRYCTTEPTLPWRGALTIPRELSLIETKNGFRLAQAPVRELQEIRGEELVYADTPTAGQTLEIESTLDRDRDESFAVCVGADDRTRTTIGYDAARRTIYVDRTKSRAGKSFHGDFPGRYTAPILSHSAEKIPLRVFVDRTSVEVFADNGLSVLTVNTFPDPAATRMIPPSPATKNFKVWRVNSIWNSKE
jgi:fructan beta-fructosidase